MARQKSTKTKVLLVGVILLHAVLLVLLLKVLKDRNLLPKNTSAANPGWIVSCNYSHSANNDPIVFFGQTGASHLHDFVGAKNTDAFSTALTLKTGGTTCAITGDTSSYWVPAMYKNGVRVLPNGTSKHALHYYRRIGAPTGVEVKPIPDGLKMIVGNASARSAAENRGISSGNIIFKCGPGSSTDLPQPPTQCDSGIMVVSYKFPNCWNGRDLDSADHFSHMAYPSGGKCPTSHPVVIPRVESFFRYPVGTGPIGTIGFDSGPYYTAHEDFFGAWNSSAMQFLLTKCINGNTDCGQNPRVP